MKFLKQVLKVEEKAVWVLFMLMATVALFAALALYFLAVTQ